MRLEDNSDNSWLVYADWLQEQGDEIGACEIRNKIANPIVDIWNYEYWIGGVGGVGGGVGGGSGGVGGGVGGVGGGVGGGSGGVGGGVGGGSGEEF